MRRHDQPSDQRSHQSGSRLFHFQRSKLNQDFLKSVLRTHVRRMAAVRTTTRSNIAPMYWEYSKGHLGALTDQVDQQTYPKGWTQAEGHKGDESTRARTGDGSLVVSPLRENTPSIVSFPQIPVGHLTPFGCHRSQGFARARLMPFLVTVRSR